MMEKIRDLSTIVGFISVSVGIVLAVLFFARGCPHSHRAVITCQNASLDMALNGQTVAQIKNNSGDTIEFDATACFALPWMTHDPSCIVQVEECHPASLQDGVLSWHRIAAVLLNQEKPKECWSR